MQVIPTKKLLEFFLSVSSLAGMIIVFAVSLREFEDLRKDILFSNNLSYFTIQSNIMVFVVSYLLLLGVKFKSTLSRIFYYGTAVNICVTGVVYTFILAGVWDPKGWALVGDTLLHYLTPLLFFIYWCLYSKNLGLTLKLAQSWLIYPILYLIFTLLRGLTVDFYPYPFVDAREVSYQQILVNSIGMGVLFIIVGGILLAINKAKAK